MTLIKSAMSAARRCSLVSNWIWSRSRIEPDDPHVGQCLEQLTDRAVARDLRVVGVEDHGAGLGGNDLLQGIATIGVDHVQIEPVLMLPQPSGDAFGEQRMARQNHDAGPIHDDPRLIATTLCED